MIAIMKTTTILKPLMTKNIEKGTLSSNKQLPKTEHQLKKPIVYKL